MKHAIALLLALTAATIAVAAQDPLSAARDLYASAAYEEALSALARIKDGPPDLVQQADQYRAFSLFALGRTAEAEAVIEALIRRDPLAKADARDASPRITALFVEVRKRLLPELIRERYRVARATMDSGDLAGAVPQLEQVRDMLAEAKSAGVSNDAMADMDVLVSGFLDLARSAADREVVKQPEASAEVAAPPPSPPPPPPSAAAETVAARTPAIYSALDDDVVAPVAIRQQLPTIPFSLARSMTNAKAAGVLEVTIDERGRVDEAMMREPVNPFFDSVVIAAARSWQYKPATKNGEPVRYTKRIGVSLASLVK
jgi:TonB family protein